MADIAIGSTIRWHIYAPGAWDWYSSESQVQEVFDPNSIAPVTAQADIKQSDYPNVAALARASILADQPISPTSQKITYLFESGVPIENQNMIKEGADNFLNHFGNILNYSGTAVGVIAYKTLPGGLALARTFDPSDIKFQEDMSRTFPNQVDPEKVPTVGMGGFSVGYKRLVVVGAPYFKSSESNLPTYLADPVVTTHELAHEVQASINKGTNMRNPVWLCEGGAQVMGSAMSVYQGKDYWAIGGREQWSNRIPANRTIADLKIMEGEDPKLSEYTTGAALSEYLIAWGGFSNSLLVNQISFKLRNPDTMSGFRQAFKIVYGQSLDDFYIHALPYINYVSANWKSAYATSPEALAFITERLGAVKAAETVAVAAAKAAADKAAVDKAAADKVTADLKAKQEAEAKAAADKVAADLKAKQEAEAKAAADKVAAKKKITITCVKGKLTKKVTAVKPVCPAGYKKKA
jgi:molybdopterin-biosynthesis enzyme MoeA-like protein